MASVLEKSQKKKSMYSLKDLKTLGHKLLSSRAHINNLPILLNFVSPSSPSQHALESILSLQSFFIPVLPEIPSFYSKSSLTDGFDDGESLKDPELVYRTWLRSKFDEFCKSLVSITVSAQSEEILRDVALDAIMEFVKLGKGGNFQSALYHKFLHSVVHSTLGVDVLLELLTSRFFIYVDVRFFTYISVERLCRNLDSANATDNKKMSAHDDGEHISGSSSELAIHKIHYILSHIPPLEIQEGKSDYETWSESGFSTKEIDEKGSNEVQNVENGEDKLKKHESAVLSTSKIPKKMKLKFTKAWLSFLRLPLPLDLYKEVLVNLHQKVIPYLSNPMMLCDLLTRSYDIGGAVGVLALSSLYVLMTQHGLEYPNFYEKLYALLVPSVFMAKHRAKFFQQLDSCLKSPLLPAYLAAAFTKKLSRLALVVPPSGGLIIIALIHNLLRRHPSINFLVHWQADDETEGDAYRGENEISENLVSSTSQDTSSKRPGIDPFNIEETDPAKSNAMRSSLWEIGMLRHHYCPAVSRFVASLENDLTIRSKTTEVAITDFSSGSYATIFRDEIGRRIKQVPLAFYKETPTSLFSESDFAGWTFKFNEKDKGEIGNEDNGAVATSVEDTDKSAKRQRIECS